MIADIPQLPTILLPTDTVQLETQVAGHVFQEGTNNIGMLKDINDDSVLKHIGKPLCGAREIAFYESLKISSDDNVIMLRNLVPEYKGTVKLIFNDKEMEFIKLNDLTHNMIKPCIMDIKVGKITYDPLATPEKIAAEEEKYAACKKQLGLCIPGFQYYKLPNNLTKESYNLQRFGKEFGKKLNQKTFKDTLKLFLNMNENGLCNPLIEEMLQKLRLILEWSRMQKLYKIYCSSILLAYDAERLNDYYQQYLTNSTNTILIQNYVSPDDLKNNSYQNKNHKTTKLNKFKIQVRMIDFAHTFPSDGTLDSNYIFGIQNLVKIFEEFLIEMKQ